MISSTAKPMPASATARRSGLWRNCAQPSGVLIRESPCSRPDHDLDLQVRPRRDRLRVVEQHLDIADARVLLRRGVGADLIELAHLLADALHRTGQRLVERAARHRGLLPDPPAPLAGLEPL